MKLFKKSYILICVLFFLSQTTLFGQRVVTDSFDFGFEGTSVSDWTQVAGFEEETTIVASGAKSMKVDMTYPTQSPKLQTFRNPNTSNGSFELIAGEYVMSVMVYLVGDSPSQLKISPTNAPIIPDISLQGVAKGAWVKLEMPFTVVENEARNDAWVIIQFLNLPSTGSGTIYIDDVIITGEDIVVEDEVPSIVKIETVEEAHIYLDKGTYNISLNVWLDPAATTKYFYTNLEEPWTSIKWDIESVAKGEWVELEETFQLKTDAENSKFVIQINNNPEYGGGTGTFFIDDITIEENRDYELPDNFTIKVTGETCPDKDNGQIEISTKYPNDYSVKYEGSEVNFTESLILENIEPGTHDICIAVSGTTFEQCYTLVVDESNPISGKSSVKSNKVSVDISGGTAPFEVSINGEFVLQTLSKTFSLEVQSGDLIEVKSNKACEGLFLERIGDVVFTKVYPNPVTDLLHVVFPEKSNIYMYNIIGNQVLSIEQSSKNHLDIPVSNLSKGLYVVKIVSDNDDISIHKVMIE